METEKARKAFELVTPERFGAKDWREPIEAVVTGAELAAAGVTIEEVKEAVAFMTATEARVNNYIIAGHLGEKGLVHYVKAVGYRRGPAGP